MEHSESFWCLAGYYLERTPGAVSPDKEQGIVLLDDPDGIDNCMTNVSIGHAVLPC
jgi:hypothetical protein